MDSHQLCAPTDLFVCILSFDAIMTLLLRRVSAGIVCLLFAYIRPSYHHRMSIFCVYKSLLRHMKKSTNHKNTCRQRCLSLLALRAYHQTGIDTVIIYVTSFLLEDSFDTRVMSLPASVCVCVSVCVNHLLVRAITRDPFNLEHKGP